VSTSPTPEEVLNRVALQIKGGILSEVYARVEHVHMLAHYTSVPAFQSIIKSRELHFSLVRDTNDTSEVTEGARIVAAALEEQGPKLFSDYESFDTARQFEERRELLETDTYVLSLCEHGSDRRTDRLEMWKDYGHGGNGLCLVLRKETMLGQTAQGRFPVHWVPIEYARPNELNERVRRRLLLIKRIIGATQHAETLPPPVFGMVIAQCVVQLVLGHKNVGFEYEREVRFVRSRLIQEVVTPDHAIYRNVTFNGVTRAKFIVPLRKYPEFGIDASAEALLDHIIIGPSKRQSEMREEIAEFLNANGLGHVPIVLSEIPYRSTS
jgi:hypothetical protein